MIPLQVEALDAAVFSQEFSERLRAVPPDVVAAQIQRHHTQIGTATQQLLHDASTTFIFNILVRECDISGSECIGRVFSRLFDAMHDWSCMRRRKW